MQIFFSGYEGKFFIVHSTHIGTPFLKVYGALKHSIIICRLASIFFFAGRKCSCIFPNFGVRKIRMGETPISVPPLYTSLLRV